MSITIKKLSNSKVQKRKDDELWTECAAVFLMVFNSIDDEVSTPEELIELLQYCGFNPSRKSIMKYWNSDTESYNFEQFLSIVKEENKTSKESLSKAFQMIDQNSDGYITHEELIDILTKRGERMTKAEMNETIENCDFNVDGKLDYEEFCHMMENMADQCKKMNLETDAMKLLSEEKRNGAKRSSSKVNENLPNKRHSLITRSKNNQQEEDCFITEITSEPANLNRWNYSSMKGCVYKEDDDLVSIHQYTLKVTQPTTLWITIKTVTPKYGKFDETILKTDLLLFLLNENGKLISLTSSIVNKKLCLQADVDAGVYKLHPYSSGVALQMQNNSGGQTSLLKGTGAEVHLSKACKDSLLEIFYRCDLDGNGYLSREEFDGFQMRTSGEECDDDAWEMVKETVEMTPHSEITSTGFLDLNLMEANDPEGGQDELWVTFESMGYSRKLNLVHGCPFFIEVFSKRGQCKIVTSGVHNRREVTQSHLMNVIKSVSNVVPFKNKPDVLLRETVIAGSTFLAVENKTKNVICVRLNCSKSSNLQSHTGDLDANITLHPTKTQLIHHLVKADPSRPSKVHCTESILR